ncbi:alpha/beta hydrolase [Kitasatospora sp. NPDC051705]|uniref:alpha/beta hydrolase n=1 Tax=Kitasatospora sp. NPDC051705 TaxID=3364057 RepID=UPI0037967C22
MDLAGLRDAGLADLHTAADAYDELCRAYARHVADWRGGTADRVRGSGWSGPAATAAATVLDGVTGKLDAAMTELGCIGRELRACADSLALAQGTLHQALADARAEGFAVDGAGAVSRPASDNPFRAVGWEARQKAAAEDIARRIGSALSAATRADEGLAAELDRFARQANDASGLDGRTAAADVLREERADPLWRRNMPAGGATPTEVRAWWQGLGPQGRQWFLDHHPEELGNLDGVPAQVRDQVNRARLEALLRAARDRAAAGLPPTPGDRAALARYGPVADRLGTGRGEPPLYLLGLGEAGRGRAILSYGNPDTATDIAVYVPGITTTTESLGTAGNVHDGTNEAENALSLYRAAGARAPAGRAVASIVWLGYDPPGADFGAASTRAGKDGAPAYARFLSGLRASNEGVRPPHVTAVGHSYGSYLVGRAAGLAAKPGSPDSPPDDVVLLGSPGVGADRASDLGLPPGRVWVGAADNDVVTHTPSRLSIDPDERWFGRDPASRHFGANRFTVDDWSRGNPVDAHTKYLTGRGGPSLGNVAAIVTGSGDVRLTGGR